MQRLLTDQWVESRDSLSLQSALVHYFLPLLSPMILNFSHVIFFYFYNISPLKVYEEIQFISNLIVQNIHRKKCNLPAIHTLRCLTVNAAGPEWRKEISSLFITQSMWKQNSRLLLCTLPLLLSPGQTHPAQETTGGRTLGCWIVSGGFPPAWFSRRQLIFCCSLHTDCCQTHADSPPRATLGLSRPL